MIHGKIAVANHLIFLSKDDVFHRDNFCPSGAGRPQVFAQATYKKEDAVA